MSIPSPPRPSAIKYAAPYGTRWEREKASAGQEALEFPNDPSCIGPWIIGECVGKGASGRVRIAKHRTTGQLAAVKILPIQPVHDSRASLNTKIANSDKQRLGIDKEIAMMKLMNHPNIMRIYDVFEGETDLFLVLEYVKGGELFDFLVNRGRLSAFEALTYFKQIIYGLNYAHTFSIIHRDLKPENILIHSIQPPLVKIADWGMAAFAPPSHQLETSCGSPHYASPEIVQGHKYSGTATDIWSCGVILYALLVGRLPFDDKNIRHLLSKVKSGKYEVPTWVDPLAADLLSKMLVVDVKERITIPQIMLHPWFKIPTPTVQYTITPTPEELALPLSSATNIDGDLLETLRIIWGRQTDPWGNSIREELLGPPGEGVLAKAFYFLLVHYRDRVLKDNEGDWEHDSRHVIKQYVAPSPNYLTFMSSREQSRRAAAATRESLNENKTPITPRSPRTPLQSPRMISDLESPGAYPRFHQADQYRQARATMFAPSFALRTSSAPSASTDMPKPHPKFRPHSVAPSPSPDWYTSFGILTPDDASNRRRSFWSPPMREPVTFIKQPQASPPRKRSPLSPKLPSIAPMASPSSQNCSNISVDMVDHEIVPKRDKVRYKEGKENMSVDTDGWCDIGEVIDIERAQNVGLGLVDNPRKALRKVRSVNVVHIVDAPSKKENKLRPISTLKSKRSTISLSASPMVLSPQPSNGLNARSPVVGEVKGWIANLFHRKASISETPVLYSPFDLATTCREFCVYLHRIDVNIVEETPNMFKCRVDEDNLQGFKALRFRAEVSDAQPRYSQELPLLNGTQPTESVCEVLLVLEKGSTVSFKALFRRLKWEAEAKGSFISTHRGGSVVYGGVLP